MTLGELLFIQIGHTLLFLGRLFFETHPMLEAIKILKVMMLYPTYQRMMVAYEGIMACPKVIGIFLC